MTLIVLGLLLWWGAHLWKRVAPGPRALMGEPGKGLVTVGVLAGVVLMVIGFRGSDWLGIEAPDFVELWRGFAADPSGSTPAEFGTFLKADRERWAAVVKKAGVKID